VLPQRAGCDRRGECLCTGVEFALAFSQRTRTAPHRVPARIRLRQTFPRRRARVVGHGYGRRKEKNNAIE
jgi:hypothetical protein